MTNATYTVAQVSIGFVTPIATSTLMTIQRAREVAKAMSETSNVQYVAFNVNAE